ncbi:MAG: autotransporter-associated beta strand repeat-containing protein, partial [Verrucomicrobiales bacterium]|nr:autotransporter-associated beta strand repeat-containing protein [Verrucomicrobiales bacterium]
GSGGSLALDNGGGGVAITKSGSAFDYITSNILLAEQATINVNDGVLVLTGGISGAGVGFTKEGGGLLVLRGASTYTGPTILNGGMTLLVPTANDGTVLGTTAGNTTVSSGATLAFGPDAAGSGAIGNPSEPLTISGDGFRNSGALRGFMGANGSTHPGVVTLAGDTRIQNDAAGTFTLSNGAFNSNDFNIRAGGVGFVSISGTIGGTGNITHYGISGLRLQGNSSTISGSLVSELGEIRADTSNTTTGDNPYKNISSLTIKNGLLQLAAGTTGAITNLFDDDIPITLNAGRIRLESTSFNNTSTQAWNEVLGPVTIASGDAFLDMRDTTGGAQRSIKLTSFTRSPGTTLRLSADGGAATTIGTGTQYRIFNAALDGGGNVAFVGGWAYGNGTATTQIEFLKYNDGALSGNGYTALTAGDYATDTAVGTWGSTQNIKISATSPTLAAATTTIQSLNIAGTAARTLGGVAGSTLIVDSGGIITTGNTTHNITVPYLTAGAASNYELYLIATNSNLISSDITDNGGNPVSVVKTGGGTSSFLTANSYTGTTYLNEGTFRGVIGAQAVALGSGNLTFGGSSINQGVYENDGDFVRSLGSGVGQVQFLGGTGAGFSAYGAPVDVNFGGAGSTVTWGSPEFNAGVFTLNGGNATHVTTLINPLDLAGEQRYLRIDGSGSGTERAAIGIIAGDVSNGSLVKRGGGTLIFDAAKSYENGTIISQGALWLRGDGTAGANVIGNDIQIAPDGYLRIESPSNIGSHQMIILQNNDNNTPAVVSFGPGYGTGEGIAFSSLTATGGTPGSGPYNVLIANNQSGQARRVAVTISGLNDFQNDIPGQIRAIAPNVEAWFGADNGNGVYTGASLSPSGGAVSAYRLGGHTNNGGVLTIANANVLTDSALGAPTPLIVGAPDQTDRNYTDGTVWIPQAQSFSGQVTIGQGGILWVGENGALGTGTADINMRSGELRLDVANGAYGGFVGTQYQNRNVSVIGGTGTIRTSSLDGGGYNTVLLGNITYGDRDSSNNRVLQIFSIGTNFTDLQVNNISPNLGAAGNFYLDVGVDNSFQAGAGMLTVAGIIDAGSTGAQNLRKRNGGVLILQGDNTYDGNTFVEQGRLVLSNTGAAGLVGSTITLATNGARRSDLEYRIDGSGPFLFNNPVATTGGDVNSTRVITVGPVGPGSEDQVVQIPSLNIGHAGGYTVGGSVSSAIFFDGFNGYRTTVTGPVTLGVSISLRTRGALTTFDGIVSGSGALEKNDQGTLVLNGNNNYTGSTTISNGYLIAGSDTAFGNATSDIIFRNNVFSQILASGARTISRNFINTATGSTQTLGGLDNGAKLFSGNVNLSTRGIALTAFGTGDTTFSGVISGGFGVEKQGNGTVFLTNGNTFTGGTTVTQGALVGTALASGSPFGSGAISMADGDLRLVGLAGSTTTTAGALTSGGGARIAVDATAGGATTFTFASLARTGSGSVTFVPTTGSLNTNEIFKFTSAPTLVNGIVGPWAVHTTSGSSNVADYVGLSGNNIVTATYAGSDLNASTATQVIHATGGGLTLTGDGSVFAFRADSGLNLGAFTLNVGDNATPANGAGIILNNGADINGSAGSRINIGNTALNIFVDDSAISSLNVPIHNTRNNVNNTQATVFTKFGPGTLEIGAVQQFEGNIELNRGTLSFTAPNVLPFFSNLNGTSGSIIIMSPGTTIDLNNNDQEFGNLSAVNPSNSFQFSAGTLNLGTATLTVGREDSSQTFNGQILGGAGSRIVKAGAGTLTFDNINGNKPSTLDTLEITRGAVSAWVNDNSWATPTTNTSAIPASTTILLRGGQYTALAIGDSTSNQQRINIGNDIIHQGADSVFRVDRATGGGSNKLLTFGDLTLDVQRFLVNNGNTFIARMDGTTTLTNHARLQTDNSFVLGGVITDGGKGWTLNKIGGSDLSIGADNSANWSGGLVITGGTLLFGTRGLDDIRSPGVTFVPLATANAGTGDIIVNLGSAIRLAAPSNVLTAQGQEVRVYGADLGSTTRVDLMTDDPVTAYGLRSLTDGSISLGLSEGTWTTPLNQAKFGNGRWGLSALSNTLYTPTTLGAGVNNIYNFNGTNAGILSIANSNVITGSASVELGKSSVFAGINPSGSTSNVRFYGDQDYTGNTTIYRGADTGSIGNILELTGNSASPVFDVYGRLTLRGDGRVTNDAGAQVNTVNLYPGSNLRLDYSMDVADYSFISRLNESNLGLETDENKWGDTTPLLLDSASINLISSTNRVNQETVGGITIKGGAGITLERSGSGQIVLRTPSITRVGQATLTVRNTSVAELGSINLQSQKLFVTGAAPTLTNGMVAPWMINASGRNFLSYDSTVGFTNAPFVTGTPVLGGGDAFLSSVSGTDIVTFAGTWGDTTLTSTKNVYALRVDEESGTNDMVFTGGQFNIWSGGLILGSDDSNRVSFNTTNVYFGNGTTPVEGIIYGGHSTPNSHFGGVITAANLTIDGPGGFHFTNTSNAITGTIQMNGGRLYLDGAGTQGTASEIILYSEYANNFNGNQMADLRLRHNSATTTFSGLTVTVGENVPYAQIQAERYTGAGTTNEVQIQNLNILGTSGPAGTLVRLNNSNSNAQVLGTTTIGGTSTVGLNVNTATWRLAGAVTSAAPIIKTGDGVLRFDGANGGFTGGFTLNRGEWRLNGANADVDGTGSVSLNFGAVRMANSGANTSYFDNAGQNVSVNGQVTFINDRDGGTAARVRTIGLNNGGNIFSTTNSPYVIFQSASFGDDIVMESELQINGSPVIRTDSADLFLREVVTGNGTLNKAGIWFLHFDNNAPNSFSGGFNNLTGITTVRQANATLGTGPVQIFAGTGLSIASTAQLGTTGLTKVLTSGTALPVIGTRTIANFNSITAAVAGVISGTGNGVLSIDNGQNLTVDPSMALRDGGVFNLWQLGSIDGGTLSANSVAPWGVGGTEFRLGGGSSTLTVGPGTAGSDQFAGVGNKMILGVAHTVMGYGGVTINANGNNSFDGGTLVNRGRNLDGGYRGFVLSVQGGANGATWRTPLGSGQIDNYGDMRYEGAAGTAVGGIGLNSNNLVLHPGSRLRFDNGTTFNGTGGGGRWADGVAIALNSSVLDMAGGNSTSAFNSETVGDISVAGGSEVVVRRNTTANASAELIAGNLTRSGNGTLMLRHDSGFLGASTTAVTASTTTADRADRFIVSNGASLMNNNMVDPWIVSRSEGQFLKYDGTAGFQTITQGGAPANYIATTATTLNGSVAVANNGTEILSLEGTSAMTMGANLDLYALRVSRQINATVNNSADNSASDIIIRSGGLIFANTGGTDRSPTLNQNLYFGSSGTGDGEALVFVDGTTGQFNGKIYANQVTKSGTGFLNIRSDQPQFTGDWVINGGGVQFLTPNAQSTGEVILSGAHMTDNDNTLQITEVRYNFNSGSPDLFTWGGGKITVNDIGIIRSVATADRLDQIPAIDLKSSGGGMEGIVFFQSDSSRHTIRTGTVTLHDNYMLSVDATSFGPGSTSGVQLGAGDGTGGLNNQGLYSVRLTGDGILSLGDNSASFTGAGNTFSVGDGTVRVMSNGAFGNSDIIANLRSTGVMEIAVANFAPLATLVQEPGSIERWARSDARGTGNYTFNPGVHWQVFTDVSGARTIDLAGGSIMGYLPLDYDEVAVIQTIRSEVTVNLTADSFLGQVYPAGTSNGSNHFMYDMGKLNTTTNLNPSDVGLRGSYLVIDGDITGNFNLTKVGQD